MQFFGAREGRVILGETSLDYITFGRGQKAFVIIPGLGDGLRTVRGTKLFLARMYKLFAKDFKVYVFSRKNHLETGYSTQCMATDQKKAMDYLEIKNAHVMGISQGGMIAQYLAIDYPRLVDKLVLGVSVSRPNDLLKSSITNWIALARDNDYRSLVINSLEKTYTEQKLRKYRPFYSIITSLGKHKDFNRFIIQAEACLTHNAYGKLHKITCPTLILGGDSDNVVGEIASSEMAGRIKDSKLILYQGLGHGAYEETKDFNKDVFDFLRS